jgi:hypothetical protein
MTQYDLIVVGAGAGGTGAAITAARQGLRVLWIERESRLGGTGVNAFVNVWQAAYTASRLAPEICQRLIEKGAGGLLALRTDTPSGRPIYRLTQDATYADTLRAWYGKDSGAPLVVYTPEGMDVLLREMARETGRIDLWTDAPFVDLRTEPDSDGLSRIAALVVQTASGPQAVSAPWYIDATADIEVARHAGCAWRIGWESAATYGEPSAPAEASFRLNGWTLCFLAREGEDRITGPAGGGPDSDWAHIGEMPDGGYYVNMVLQVQGEVGWQMGMERAREFILGNIFKRWPGVQKAYGLEGYGITTLAPRIGVREGPRLLARYVLTENDILQGGYGQHHDDCIAYCDFGLDPHVPGRRYADVPNGPWGVPLRCLQPREVSNLLVASRGAGFSSLAASACRLQRTIIELGEGAARFAAKGKAVLP